jgi:hypothetical protein
MSAGQRVGDDDVTVVGAAERLGAGRQASLGTRLQARQHL